MKHNSVLEGGVIAPVISHEDSRESAVVDYTKARKSRLKRAMDIGLCSVGLVVAAPLLGVVALAIKLGDGGDAIFSQERPGVDGKLFNCYKFRTMAMDAEDRLTALIESDPAAREEWDTYKKLKNDPRITWIGRFLRKTSIDELPQLINILRGDMSIIGPRPITKREIPDYGTPADFEIYGSVRPGVLGLWQISGRSDASYTKRIRLDAKYAREWSIGMDLKILFLGVPVIILARGAY